MDERNEKTETLTASDAIPGAKFVDPRPSDLDVFYALLPGVLGSLAAKSTDSRSANAMALTMVREALGQCAALGILRVQTQCLDGQLLASLPQNVTPMGVQQPIQHQPGAQGSMVAQYQNHPGQGMPTAGTATGGVVQQYPNYAPPTQQGGMPNGNKGVLVAMFPNGTQPPQL